MLDKKFFEGIATEVVERYRKHIFVGAKDVYGRKFKNYSTLYSIRKISNSFKRQWEAYANTKAPVLTGDLLRDYGHIKTKDDKLEFGWSIYGGRVEHLRKMGRVLTHKDSPMPVGIVRYVAKESKKYICTAIQKKFGKNKTRVHKIGKK